MRRLGDSRINYSNGDKLTKQRSTLADYVRSLKYTARVAGNFVGHEALVRSELIRALLFSRNKHCYSEDNRMHEARHESVNSTKLVDHEPEGSIGVRQW